MDSPLSWLAIPLLDVPVYGGLIAAALLNRRTPQTHKRLMLTRDLGNRRMAAICGLGVGICGSVMRAVRQSR